MKSWSSNDYNKDTSTSKNMLHGLFSGVVIATAFAASIVLCLVFERSFSLLFVSFIFSISSVHTWFRFLSLSFIPSPRVSRSISRDTYMIFAFCLFFEMFFCFGFFMSLGVLQTRTIHIIFPDAKTNRKNILCEDRKNWIPAVQHSTIETRH